MIIAKDFVASERAQAVELQYSDKDHPLVMQFAANDPIIFAKAAQIVAKFLLFPSFIFYRSLYFFSTLS